jgi:outer membrane protein
MQSLKFREIQKLKVKNMALHKKTGKLKIEKLKLISNLVSAFQFFVAVMIFTLLNFAALAQEKLTLPDAFAIGLKNNYSITIARNDALKAANDNIPGNAGLLPSVSLNASGNKSINDTKQKYSNGAADVNRNKVASDNLAASGVLDWTIFDGFKMFATKSRLNELQIIGELDAKVQIENTLEQIISSYYSVVREKQLLKAVQEAINIYQERVRIAQTKFEIGSSAKIDLLQAKVDYNAQRSEQLNEQTVLRNAKITLNRLLSRPADTEFDVADTTIPIVYAPKLEELKTTVVKQNYTLLSAERNVNVSSFTLNEVKSERYPRIGVTAGYYYSKTDNAASLVLLNQNTGPAYGFNISWNIFNGSVVNSRIKNARLDYENSTLHLSDIKTQIEADLLSAYQTFESNLELLKLEEENLVLAVENVQVSLERYRVGKGTQIELTLAQKNLDDAENRTVSARYNTKLSETTLMKLNGELVK